LTETKEKATARKATKKNKTGVQSAKVYFVSALIVVAVSFFGSLLTGSFSTVTIETSGIVLENVIRLDGVLFGFTATMISIFYFKAETRHRKFLKITIFSVTAFLSYLLSIYMSFSFLMAGERSGGIFLPVILACFGGLCSSVYIVLVMIDKELKEG
jgi:hypothetical protein